MEKDLRNDKVTKGLFLIIFLIYTWFITYGSWNIFKSERFGIAYDSLSQSLLNGECTVPLDTIEWEAFSVNGKTYMYFGPWPSFLRILLNYLFPSFYGNWSKFSCLLAAILCLIAFTLIIRNQLLRNSFLSHEQRKFFFYLSLIGFGLGSPIVFLMSWGCIYYEAILWGLCWGIWGIFFLTGLLFDTKNHSIMLFGLSLSAGLALLSRVTFGIPFYLILIFILLNILLKTVQNKTSNNYSHNAQLFNLNIKAKNIMQYIAKIFILISPAIIALGFQLWYNQCRFGSVTSFSNYKFHNNYIKSWWSDEFKNEIEKDGPFNIRRVPFTATHYFGIRNEYFSKKAPFFKMALIPKLNTKPSIISEWSISLTISSLWLIWGGIFGLLWLFKIKETRFIWFCLYTFFIQVILVLSYMGVSHRYSADFIPFLIFLYSIYLFKLGKQEHFHDFQTIKSISTLICFISISSTLLSTLDHLANGNDTLYPPISYKEKLHNYFNSVDAFVISILKN